MTNRKDLSVGMLPGGKKMRQLLILACTAAVLGLLCATPSAWSAEAEPHKGYRVGIFATGLPFIEKTKNGSYIGAEVELWEEIARRTGFTYHYREMRSLTETLDAVAEDELDFALSSTTLTGKRSKLMAFSYPYYVSGQAILVNAKEMNTIWTVIEVLCCPVTIHAILALLVLLLIYGHILWLAERGKVPQVKNRYFPGVFEAMWCVFAIKTTIGFGDVVPRKWTARILSVPIWLSGILLTSVITAQLISVFVASSIKPESNISDYRDLLDKKVAVLDGSTGMIAVADLGIKDVVRITSTEEGYDKLLDREVDALVFDYPTLAHETDKLRDEGHPVMIVGEPFTQEFYAIPMSPRLAVREPDLMSKINSALFSMYDEKYLDRSRNKWMSGLDVR